MRDSRDNLMAKKKGPVKDISTWEMDAREDILQVRVSTEMAKELRELAESYLWEGEEGLRMILGAGKAALEAQRLIQEEEGASNDARLRHLTRQLVRSEGRLAATRYRLFEAEQEINRLVLSNAGLRELGLGMEKALNRQLEEIDVLKRKMSEKQDSAQE
jgi:hypothetical protein